MGRVGLDGALEQAPRLCGVACRRLESCQALQGGRVNSS